MVVRMLTRGDPVAALKAGAITAALYGGLYMLPEDKKLEFSRWAMTDPHSTYWLAAFVVGFMALLTLISFRAELWTMATFRSFPKRAAHHTGCIVWLHGVGDCGSGFNWLRTELSYMRHVTFLLPDADKRPLAAADGATDKRAWFGLQAMPVTLEEPEPEGLAEAIAKVHAWIDAEVAAGMPPSRIILGGFSQGAALAAWAAAKAPYKLGGVVLWSGWAPQPLELESALRQGACAHGVPFILCHGAHDRKVLPECAKRLGDALDKAGVQVHMKQVYEGLGHGCTPEQLDKFKDFVAARIPEQPPQGGEGRAPIKKAGKAE